MIDLGLLDGLGRLQLLVGAHDRVERHVAEVAREHRVAAAILDGAEILRSRLRRDADGGLGLWGVGQEIGTKIAGSTSAAGVALAPARRTAVFSDSSSIGGSLAAVARFFKSIIAASRMV